MAKPTALRLVDEGAESTLGEADPPRGARNGNDKALLPAAAMR